MTSTKINDADIANLKISSLPSRPTAPTAFGGRGYTASEMKEAFDKLPLYIIEKFNALLEDISAHGDGSLADEIPTGIREEHSLYNFFCDIVSGAAAGYIKVIDMPLAEAIADLRREIARCPGIYIELGEDIESMNTRIDGIDERLTDSEDTYDRLGEQISAITAEADSLKSEIASNINEINSRQDEHNIRIGSFETDLEEVTLNLDIAQQNIGEISENIDAIDTRMSAAESTSATLSERMAALESEGSSGGGITLDVWDPNIFEATVTLNHNKEIRIGCVWLLDVYLPETIPEDYFCILSFTTDLYDPTGMSWPIDRNIVFSGNHTEDGEFYPEIAFHYTMFFWYDGELQCNVRGVKAYG